MVDTSILAQNIPQDVPMPNAQEPIGQIGPGGQVFSTRAWYVYHETMRTRTGGDIDKVNNTFTGLQVKVDQSTQVEAGAGLQGGGTLQTSITISIAPQVGWTFGTGTPNLGVYATYAGHTWGATYDQTAQQALDNAAHNNSRRILALEQALKALGAIST